MTTRDYLHRCVIPAAFAVLPREMHSREAQAMVLSIALQESGAATRRQAALGPARGFWQFETAGIAGVRRHPASKPHLDAALAVLRYGPTVTNKNLQAAVEHNDVLAGVFARLLLWTDRAPLPTLTAPAAGWQLYLRTWQPGRPHGDVWAAHFTEAWALVESEVT